MKTEINTNVNFELPIGFFNLIPTQARIGIDTMLEDVSNQGKPRE